MRKGGLFYPLGLVIGKMAIGKPASRVSRDYESVALMSDKEQKTLQKGFSVDSTANFSGIRFEDAMAKTRMAICLCDPYEKGLPIVFANKAFQELTGYEEDEILGRSCRFLQGPGTDKQAVQLMRNALAAEEVVVVELLNYRKDGSAFWNALHLGPIYNEKGELVYFYGGQWDVSDVRAARAEEQHARQMARELSHRMKNMFAVVAGIINVTGRVRGIQKEAAEINSRIQALGRAYETTLDDASRGVIDIGEAIRSVMLPYQMDRRDRLVLNGGSAGMPFPVVSIVGLVLHEFAANAERYGAWSVPKGSVVLEWQLKPLKGQLTLTWTELGGPQINPVDIKEGSGSAIVDKLLRSDVGRIERYWDENGFKAVLTLQAKA